MLGDYPLEVVLLATDLAATRDFYRDKIGLELLSDNPNAVTFKCGSTQLAITKSTVGTSDEQTQASWRVKDLDAELDALRGRGVMIEDYDLPGLKRSTESPTSDLRGWPDSSIPQRTAWASCNSSDQWWAVVSATRTKSPLWSARR